MPERFAVSDVQDATAILRDPTDAADAVDAVLFFERKSAPAARQNRLVLLQGRDVIRVPILKSLTSLKLANKDGAVMQSAVLHLQAAVST